MTIPYAAYRQQATMAAVDTIDYLTEEHAVPPLFTCLHLGGFFISSVLATYRSQGIEPPAELVEFVDKTYPKLMSDQQMAIEKQYLTLTTEGTA